MKLHYITLLLTILLSTGCTYSEVPTLTEDNKLIISVSNGYSKGTVSLVTLEDGTKCAILMGTRKGGIDCDWRDSK